MSFDYEAEILALGPEPKPEHFFPTDGSWDQDPDDWDEYVAAWEAWQKAHTELTRQYFELNPEKYEAPAGSVKSYYMDRWGFGWLSKDRRRETVANSLFAHKATGVDPKLAQRAQNYWEENKEKPGKGQIWKRVAIAFRAVADDGSGPCTAQEARDGEAVWDGWRPFREELERIEGTKTLPVAVIDASMTEEEKRPDPGPVWDIDKHHLEDLVASMRKWAGETWRAGDHVDRWQRAIVGLGFLVGQKHNPREHDTNIKPMKAAEAKTYLDRGWKRWEKVYEYLDLLERGAKVVQLTGSV